MCSLENTPVALKLERQLDTTGSGSPIKFQNDWRTLNRNLVRPRLNEILGYRPWWWWKTDGIEVVIRVLSSFLTTTYTDHPKIIRTTQPSTMGGPLGDPRFWTLDSTVYVSFRHYMWIQTGVTVRKRLSWVLTSVNLTFDLWPWPFAWTLPWSLLITPENFKMIRW